MKHMITRAALTALLAAQTLAGCTVIRSSEEELPDGGPPRPPARLSLDAVDIAGQGRFAQLQPGADVRMELGYVLEGSDCPACSARISVELAGRTECFVEDAPALGEVIAPSIRLRAPDQPGRYPLRAEAILADDCSTGLGAGTSTIIGELIVAAPDPENTPPIVDRIVVEPADYLSDCRTGLRAEARDADGDILRYEWSVAGEAPRGNGSTISLLGGPRRERVVAVTVSDGRGGVMRMEASVLIGECELPAGAVPDRTGRKAFLRVEGPATFDAARRMLAQQGVSLAHVDSLAQQALLTEHFRGLGPAWIGLRRTGDGPTDFAWLNGRPVDFAHWCRNEPNNPRELAVLFGWHDDGCWNDMAADGQGDAIVELELPGGPDDLSEGGDFDRPAFDAGGVDTLRLRLASERHVSIAVTDRQGGCVDVGDPILRVMFGGDEEAMVDDTDGRCPRFEGVLPQGLHHIAVGGYNGQALPDYRVTARVGR